MAFLLEVFVIIIDLDLYKLLLINHIILNSDEFYYQVWNFIIFII